MKPRSYAPRRLVADHPPSEILVAERREGRGVAEIPNIEYFALDEQIPASAGGGGNGSAYV